MNWIQKFLAAITTHKGDASAHHTAYNDAAAIAAAKTDAALLHPSGKIALWHGLIENIPSGWLICDGNNSTPNLLAKFVEGVATAETDPGDTGGAVSKDTGEHQHLSSVGRSATAGKARVRARSSPPWGHATGPSKSRRYGPLDGSLLTSSYHYTESKTDSIADIRPLFYDVAFIMKT